MIGDDFPGFHFYFIFCLLHLYQCSLFTPFRPCKKKKGRSLEYLVTSRSIISWERGRSCLTCSTQAYFVWLGHGPSSLLPYIFFGIGIAFARNPSPARFILDSSAYLCRLGRCQTTQDTYVHLHVKHKSIPKKAFSSRNFKILGKGGYMISNMPLNTRHPIVHSPHPDSSHSTPRLGTDMSFYIPKDEIIHPSWGFWNFPMEFGHRSRPAIATLITTGSPPFFFQLPSHVFLFWRRAFLESLWVMVSPCLPADLRIFNTPGLNALALIRQKQLP